MTTLSMQNVSSANELRNESDNTMQWQTVTNKRPQSGSPTIDQKRTKTNNYTNLADSYNSIPTTQLNNNNISSNSNSTNMFAGLQDESDSNNIMDQNIEENTPKPPPIIVPNISDISAQKTVSTTHGTRFGCVTHTIQTLINDRRNRATQPAQPTKHGISSLTQAEIEKFANLDWDDSADEESEEEEDRNMDEIIEESLKNLDNRAENVEVGLI
ncbi:probable basic-leucine zipper transcription factor G [Bactrocera neohumeralis]|uniref:probable basic-leucine zipper transcription factor G n=1 Tax=Bactrocera neohumeralis TaxID=98809 RepID=UPI002165E43B|nr:probable basic-leucine zipper transcription factor G [Bactrocera neohumeralis]